MGDQLVKHMDRTILGYTVIGPRGVTGPSGELIHIEYNDKLISLSKEDLQMMLKRFGKEE